MAWLLIDNSNTRTKFALGDTKRLQEWRAVIPTAELSEASLTEFLGEEDYSGVVIASVVPEKAELLLSYFKNTCETHSLSCRSPLGFGFDLAHPEQIGADRLANAIALKENHGCPGIAVDFGTAVTFSALSERGDFSGGVIAPGMAAMTDYLASKTAQLPRIEVKSWVPALGKTTVDALQAGAVIGQRGMVREILRELAREIAGNPKVIATGGGADFAAESIPEIDVVDVNLTLEGLRILGSRVFK